MRYLLSVMGVLFSTLAYASTYQVGTCILLNDTSDAKVWRTFSREDRPTDLSDGQSGAIPTTFNGHWGWCSLMTGTANGNSLSTVIRAGTTEGGFDDIAIDSNCTFNGTGVVISEKAVTLTPGNFDYVEFVWGIGGHGTQRLARYATYLVDPNGVNKLSCDSIAQAMYGH